MKPENLTPLKASIRLKYRLRVATAALAGGARRTANVALRVWDAVGYPIVLIALLAILGSAAYAYRQRPRQIAVQTPPPTRAAEAAVLSEQVIWPTPEPVPTPEPFCPSAMRFSRSCSMSSALR